MGFVLIGAYSGNIYGVSGAIFQMFNHAIAIGLLFMLSGYIHEQAGTRDILLLRGLRITMPKTAILLVLGSVAGMGIPAFSMFVSEYLVILGAIMLDARLVIAIGVPIITAAYFLLMLKKTRYNILK